MRLLGNRFLKKMPAFLLFILLILASSGVQASGTFVTPEEAAIRIDSVRKSDSSGSWIVTITNVSGGTISDISVCFSWLDEKDGIINYNYATDYKSNLENNGSLEMSLYVYSLKEVTAIRAMSYSCYKGADRTGDYCSENVENWYEMEVEPGEGSFYKGAITELTPAAGEELDLIGYYLSEEEAADRIELSVCIKNNTDHPVAGSYVYLALMDENGDLYDSCGASIGGFLKPGQYYWDTVSFMNPQVPGYRIEIEKYLYETPNGYIHRDYVKEGMESPKGIEGKVTNPDQRFSTDKLLVQTDFFKVYQSGPGWKKRLKADEDEAYFWVENITDETIWIEYLKFGAFDADGKQVDYTYGNGYDNYVEPGQRFLQEVSLYCTEGATDLHLISYSIEKRDGSYDSFEVTDAQREVSEKNKKSAAQKKEEPVEEAADEETEAASEPSEKPSAADTDDLHGVILHLDTEDAGMKDVRILFPAHLEIVRLGIGRDLEYEAQVWKSGDLKSGELTVRTLNSVSTICSQSDDHVDQRITSYEDYNLMMEDADGKIYHMGNVYLGSYGTVLFAVEGAYAYPVMEDASGVQFESRETRMLLYEEPKLLYTGEEGVQAYGYPCSLDDFYLFTYAEGTPVPCYGESYGVDSSFEICKWYISELQGEYVYIPADEKLTKQQPSYDTSGWMENNTFRMRCPDGMTQERTSSESIAIKGENARILMKCSSLELDDPSILDTDWGAQLIEELYLNTAESSYFHGSDSEIGLYSYSMRGNYLDLPGATIRHTSGRLSGDTQFENAEVFVWVKGMKQCIVFCGYNGDTLSPDILKCVLTAYFED